MAKEIVNSGAQYNSIATGTKITGTILADNDIRIDGELEGILDCKGKIVIGEKGSFKGTANCANSEVFGKVEGEITVSDTLSLRQTASLLGDVKTKVLLIEPNAIFNGTCSMAQNKQTQDSTKK